MVIELKGVSAVLIPLFIAVAGQETLRRFVGLFVGMYRHLVMVHSSLLLGVEEGRITE